MNKRKQTKSGSLFFWVKILAGVYCGAAVALYFMQHKLIFHPSSLPEDHKFDFKSTFEEIKFNLDKSTSIHLVKFIPPDSLEKKGAVIYFHGNSENINHYAQYADNFTKHGYEVWMMDYPGFGKSTGKIDISLIYQSADQIYNMVLEKYDSPENILIYGKSLGTGIATYLASRKPCSKLILETPYYSLSYAASQYLWMFPVEYMMKYEIPSYKYFKQISAPITIFHGTEDEVVNYKNALLLEKILKKDDQLITIKGGRHNDLNTFAQMQEKLDELLSN